MREQSIPFLQLFGKSKIVLRVQQKLVVKNCSLPIVSSQMLNILSRWTRWFSSCLPFKLTSCRWHAVVKFCQFRKPCSSSSVFCWVNTFVPLYSLVTALRVTFCSSYSFHLIKPSYLLNTQLEQNIFLELCLWPPS